MTLIYRHKPGSRLKLLSARHVVTRHHRPLTSSKFYCLMIEAHVCEDQLPRVVMCKWNGQELGGTAHHEAPLPYAVTHLAFCTTRQLLCILLRVLSDPHCIDHSDTLRHQVTSVSIQKRNTTMQRGWQTTHEHFQLHKKITAKKVAITRIHKQQHTRATISWFWHH